MTEKLIAAAANGVRVMTVEEWRQAGIRLFGPNSAEWRFVCPACGNVQTGADFARMGADPHNAYTNCLHRLRADGECKYTTSPTSSHGRQEVAFVGVIIRVEEDLCLIFPFAEGGGK